MTDPKNEMLDELFAEARSIAPEPSDALVARVLAEAKPPEATRPAKTWPVSQSGFFARLMESIGGWPAAGGLVAATVAGLWIGLAPPASIEDFTASVLSEPVAVGFFADDFAFDMGLLADG